MATLSDDQINAVLNAARPLPLTITPPFSKR